MIKFISKQIAKRYINKHREDGKLIGITNTTIKGVEFYMEAFTYIVLYVIASLIWLIGIPMTIFFLTNFWWGLLSMVVVFPLHTIVSIKLAFGILRGVRDEILTLSKTLSK